MAYMFWQSILAFYLTLFSDFQFWHSIWYLFWHPVWNPFWHLFWHFLWHSIWHSFSYSIWHLFWHSFWHLFWISFWCSLWHSILPFYLAFIRAFFLASILAIIALIRPFFLAWALPDLAVEISIHAGAFSQCPLRSGARGWGPAVPAEISRSGLGSGSVALVDEVRRWPFWDPEPAVEVWWPRRSGARGWSLAVPTEIWSLRLRCATAIWSLWLRCGSAHCDRELAVDVRQCPLRSGVRCLGKEKGRRRKEGGEGHSKEIYEPSLGRWGKNQIIV